MAFTINWFVPDQTELEFVQVEVRSTWHGHATIYPVANDATTAEIPVPDGQAVHWEVRAYYLDSMNLGKLVKAGDLYGGILGPPPSHLKIFFDEYKLDDCTNAAQINVLVTGCAPGEFTDSPSPAGVQLLNRQEDGTFLGQWRVPFSVTPDAELFEMNCHCDAGGNYVVGLTHSRYGTVGGGTGQMNEVITIDATSNFGAGTFAVQF